MNLSEAAEHLQDLVSGNLARRLASLESAFRKQSSDSARWLCSENRITDASLEAALMLKATAGQVNVLVHAIGILTALPRILRDGERIEALSLGAGNTGRRFDLETNYRVAEFKFVHWQGGAESIRQNNLFKDFFYLAEADTQKERFLYLLELDRPLRFLNGRRALASILTKDQRLRDDFATRYGQRFSVARDYYLFRRDRVQLCNLSEIVPVLTLGLVDLA